MGDIELCDLAAIGQLMGQEGVPYPFGHNGLRKQHDERMSSLEDRLERGDLQAFRNWADAFVAAEIWVACRVHPSNADNPGWRILAFRAGEAGYLAVQGNTDDVVEVSRLSALDLGRAVAGSVGLTGPGVQPRIVIPGYVGYFARRNGNEYDDDDETYRVRVAADSSVRATNQVVADDQVTAIATIQSHWQPPRKWGVDWGKTFIACVRIEADGDYIYTPDGSHAVPLSEQFLAERIDRLIADDISALRRHRGIAF